MNCPGCDYPLEPTPTGTWYCGMCGTEYPDDAVRDGDRRDDGVVFVAYDEFIARFEPEAAALVTDADGSTAIPAGGFVKVYGDGGAGKTTLILDGIVHFAAGLPWLDGLAIPTRPLRVVWVENEGPREEFRRKLARKLSLWRDRVPPERLSVYDNPWGAFDFRDDEHRAALAAHIAERGIDLAVVGPLSRLGMEGGGTPSEVRAFVGLIEDVQRRAGRLVTFLVLNHENRAGQVSGAWEGAPDLLVHVQAQGNGHTRVYWQKAKWSSALHGTTTVLAWRDGEAFELEDKPATSADTMAEEILAAARKHPGGSWRTIREHVSGNAEDAAKVRERLLTTGLLVNKGSSAGFKLWAAEDPAAPPESGSEAGTTFGTIPGFPLPDRERFSGSPRKGNREPEPVPPATRRPVPPPEPPEPKPLPGDDGYLPWLYGHFEADHVHEDEWLSLSRIHMRLTEAGR